MDLQRLLALVEQPGSDRGAAAVLRLRQHAGELLQDRDYLHDLPWRLTEVLFRLAGPALEAPDRQAGRQRLDERIVQAELRPLQASLADRQAWLRLVLGLAQVEAGETMDARPAWLTQPLPKAQAAGYRSMVAHSEGPLIQSTA